MVGISSYYVARLKRFGSRLDIGTAPMKHWIAVVTLFAYSISRGITWLWCALFLLV